MSFTVNGKKAKASLNDDYRTFTITAEGLDDTADLKISNIKDIYGNSAEDVSKRSQLPEQLPRQSAKTMLQVLWKQQQESKMLLT